MINQEKYLELLIGKVITNTSNFENYVIPRGVNNQKEIFENIQKINDSQQLFIEEYTLNLNNPIIITPEHMTYEDLVGLRIVATDEQVHAAELTFDNGSKLLVDMRDEVYVHPEAMVLYGPNGFCAVWN